VSYKYVVGIDGGGTRCRALLQDIDGNTLGEGAAGPANIMTNPEQAMGSVIDATLDAIESAALPITCEEVLLAAGLAGANIPQAKQSFLELDNPFADTVVISDLHAACLGAHDNQSGALIICGTVQRQPITTRVCSLTKVVTACKLAMMQVVRGWAYQL